MGKFKFCVSAEVKHYHGD